MTNKEKRAARMVRMYATCRASRAQGDRRLAYQIDDSKTAIVARDAIGQSNTFFLIN